MNSKNRKWDYESMKKVVDFYLLGHTYTECKKSLKYVEDSGIKLLYYSILKLNPQVNGYILQ